MRVSISAEGGTLWSANYDLLDRAQSTRAHYIPGAAAGIWVDQAWDRYGNLQSEGIRNASTGEVLSTSYAYDTRNRLSGATLPAGASLVITHNEADQRTNLAYPNGTNQGTTYLANGNVDIITLTAPGGATLERWDYAYDAVSNVDTITTTQGVYDYSYDDLDRLTSGSYPAATGLATESYLYDALGNRELPGDLNAYQYDPNNRMTVSPGTTHSYDPDGSLVGRVGERGLTVSAQYDATNRPVFWASETPSLSTYLDYAHEPQGRRIRVHAEKVTGVNTTETTSYYLWAGDHIVAEYDVAGTRTVRYAYLPGDYAPIQQATATATTYLHSDRLQTPRRGTSTAGVVTWKGDYRSFGDGTPNTDPDGNGQAVVVKHRFPGQYAEESGLSYNYYRDYDPATGRYVETDSIGLKGGLNTFEYASSNTARWTDPFGLARLPLDCRTLPTDWKGTIQCDGNGDYEIVNCGGPCIRNCVRQHEQTHISDWKARFGAKSCQNRQKGDPPSDENANIHGGFQGPLDWGDFRAWTECRAWRLTKSCAQAALGGGSSGGGTASCDPCTKELGDLVQNSDHQMGQYRCTFYGW